MEKTMRRNGTTSHFKMRIFIFLIVIVMLACNNAPSDKRIVNLKDSITLNVITCDTIEYNKITDWVDSCFGLITHKKPKYKNVLKFPTPNVHGNETDTIIRFFTHKDTLSYYKVANQEKYIFLSAVMVSNEMIGCEGVFKIGNAKELILSELNINAICLEKEYYITDKEHQSACRLIFEKDTLTKIYVTDYSAD